MSDNELSAAKDKGPQTNLPKRPRRYFLPAVVGAVVIRLELFYLASFDVQCSVPGVECFLPLLLIFYEILPGRRPRTERRKDDDETFSQTAFEDFDDWAETSAPLSLLGGLLLAYGAYRASMGSNKSTYFCSALDRASLVFWAQLTGLLLDATIIILLWRILAWARTTKSRLRTLSGILLATSLAVGTMVWLLQQYEARDGLGSLYVFDVIFDGFLFSLFIISSTFVVCEGNPSTLVGTIVMFCGILSAKHRIALAGTWENVRRGQSHTALFVLSVGFATFSYASGLRSIIYMRRILVLILLALFFVCSAIYILAKKGTLLDDYPVDKFIYNNRIEADRWLVHASVSKSVKIAVQEYQERNHRRDPPPKFDIWYKFALDRNSPIMDHFEQIGHDILPFWGLAPEKIREGVALAAQQPDIAIVKVENGAASHGQFIDSPYRPILDELVDLMKPFSEHLPNMQIAVNMNERPRVLAPWDDVQRYTQAGLGHGLRKLLSRRSVGSSPAQDLQNRVDPRSAPDILQKDHTSAQAFRQMTALACSPGSKGRSGVHWNIRDFCSTCAKPQSEGIFLKHWDMSLDICHQPDLAHLHGFHITPPSLKPLQQLVPIFSRSKTSSYSDILIPMRRQYDVPEDEPGSDFQMKYDQLFWRGKISGDDISHDLLHGGHQERLVHLINNSTSSDRATILLPSPNKGDKHKDTEEDRYRYESAPISDLTSALPINVAISSYANCKPPSPACDRALREFGTAPEDPPTLKNRYVLLTDSDNGPPVGLLPALRSTSVPFVATVFREWYTERLMPWVHFVPVDLRYQGLWSTLSYFTGLKGKGEVAGRDPQMAARAGDAVWIAEQGRTWAGRALRREDMEVYLFRVLLEYGRLVDDGRDENGFVLT
ncbi:glycosyltransferase family 90 protein [Coniochaeta ligniaria NRRL 30616]|uniref:Glycosyltransferase family 90 protein n=1 Tax=Coniochaeta ligniaria NRRL 30616 TaxID=1408157 RepID=A0A1J7J9X9_9PEZI|nr:glycosyltransferase family 90 protein [Coniochaeta ligniaria NRRL 30616]